MALKLWLAAGVLGDLPRRFGSILGSNGFSGPTVRSDQRSEACGILKMDRLHAGNVGATELAGIEKFLAHAQVFLPHFDQFAPEILVEHGLHCTGAFRLRRSHDNVLDMFCSSSIIEIWAGPNPNPPGRLRSTPICFGRWGLKRDFGLCSCC